MPEGVAARQAKRGFALKALVMGKLVGMIFTKMHFHKKTSFESV